MTYDKKAVKQPFAGIPTTDDMCGWIGKVTITWSEVEINIDHLIVALLKSTGATPLRDWGRTAFKKRKELCKDLAVIEFADRPNISDSLRELLGDAADLHWRRNLVVHGKLKTELRTISRGDPFKKIRPTIDAFVTASGQHNGKAISLTFSTNGMERLFYELGHLLGRFQEFVTPGSSSLGLSSDDKLRLHNFLVGNHAIFPTLPTPQPPPPP